jgi:hypothetical protein
MVAINESDPKIFIAMVKGKHRALAGQFATDYHVNRSLVIDSGLEILTTRQRLLTS